MTRAAGDGPVAAQGRPGEFTPRQGALFDLRRGDPGGRDRDSQAKFHELFDGFHGTQFGEGAQRHFEFEQMAFDGAKGGGSAGVEDKVLIGQLAAINFGLAGEGCSGEINSPRSSEKVRGR